MVKRQERELTKVERARNLCLGLVLTSLWLGVNSLAWWALQEARQRVSLVEDYGEGGPLEEEASLEWWDGAAQAGQEGFELDYDATVSATAEEDFVEQLVAAYG